jgi:hypothetical protein
MPSQASILPDCGSAQELIAAARDGLLTIDVSARFSKMNVED